jgi:hypothetical protein
MYQLIAHEGADAFLGRAEAWLQTREAEHNLHLSLSYARRDSGTTEPDTLFGTVEAEGEVLGCVIRTPPHKLLVTDIPMGRRGGTVLDDCGTGAARRGVSGRVRLHASRQAGAWLSLRACRLR